MDTIILLRTRARARPVPPDMAAYKKEAKAWAKAWDTDERHVFFVFCPPCNARERVCNEAKKHGITDERTVFFLSSLQRKRRGSRADTLMIRLYDKMMRAEPKRPQDDMIKMI